MAGMLTVECAKGEGGVIADLRFIGVTRDTAVCVFHSLGFRRRIGRALHTTL